MPPAFYVHGNLPHHAGCYYVTAVDRSGNECPSNTVCKDNCPYYELPNVFTPNGDGSNDLFTPFPCPRFVQSVSFVVHNRWGRKSLRPLTSPCAGTAERAGARTPKPVRSFPPVIITLPR